MEKIFHANGIQKKVEYLNFYQTKKYLKPKTIIWNKEGQYVMREKSVQQKDITFVNSYSTQHRGT